MFRTLPRWLTIFACMLIVVCCVTSIASACPTCKDAVAGDPAHENMVRGYFYSIIFMMSMPFLILTGLSTYFYLEVRKARRLQNVSSSPIPAAG